MKEPKARFFTALILGAVLAVAGCKGDAGPTGPQGDQGPEGPVGTANVIYSNWIDFDAANWTAAYSFFGQMRRDYPVTVAEIDADIIATGTVMVYVRFSGASDKVFPLPAILPLGPSGTNAVDFYLEVGSLIISMHDVLDDSLDPGTFGTGNTFRYIIIPGGVAAAAAPSMAAMPDLKDYDAVMEYYGIDP